LGGENKKIGLGDCSGMTNYGMLAIFIIFPFIWYGGLVLIYSTSCGGRENCGKRFCPIGLFNDYGFYPALVFLFFVEVCLIIEGFL